MAEHCSKNFEPMQNIDVTLLICFRLSRLISFNCFNTTKNRGQKNKENKKNTDNDLHNTTEKTKDLATGIQQKQKQKQKK
jgi:hypothetical protein